jgi:hypothetical protein
VVEKYQEKQLARLSCAPRASQIKEKHNMEIVATLQANASFSNFFRNYQIFIAHSVKAYRLV